MAKYAINYVLMPVYEIDYVIEATDVLEARRKARELLDDGVFIDALASKMEVTDEGVYEIGEMLRLDDDAPAKVGEFFFEPVS